MKHTGSHYRTYACTVKDDHMPEIKFRAFGRSAEDAMGWALKKASILTGEPDFDQINMAYTGETCAPFDRSKALLDLKERMRKKRWSLPLADLDLGDVRAESVVSNLPAATDTAKIELLEQGERPRPVPRERLDRIRRLRSARAIRA